MKTLIILGIIIVIASYGLKSLYDSLFKKKSDCSSCSHAKNCNSKK